MARRVAAWCACVAVIVLAATAQAGTQRDVVRLGEGVYALIGSTEEAEPGNRGEVGNVGLLVGDSGTVVVNTGASYQDGRRILDVAERIGGKPVVLAVITQPLQEFVMGNAAFAERGIPVLAHEAGARLIAERCENCLRDLKRLLGEDVMRGTQVIVPGRTLATSADASVGGRTLRFLHFGWGSTPGDLAVFDVASGVLFAGALVSVGRVPEMRDADFAGWLDALSRVRALPVVGLVPGYGRPGGASDVEPMTRYLTMTEQRVRGMQQAGEGLLEAVRGADLPEFAGWALYDVVHRRNVQRTFLRLEAEELAR